MSEATRLASVKGLDIIGTEADAGFDRLVQLAAAALAAPLAVFSIIDATHIWRKARIGEVPPDASREGSFCTRTIETGRLFVVPDASVDPRFADSAFVIQYGVRFYAGTPVRLEDGEAVGALCVLDSLPRTGIDPAGAALLEGLAAAAGHLLDLRRELAARREAEHRLSEQARMLELAEEMADLGTWRLDFRSGRYRQSVAARRIHGCDAKETDARAETILALYDPADRSRIVEAVDEARATGAGYSLDASLRRAGDGECRDVRIRARIETDTRGQPVALVGVLQDVTRDKEVLKIIHGRRVEADRLASEMRVLATIDALTGLLNRRAFLEVADAALARGRCVELVVIDIDHFKSVNDRYGHSGGDLVLAAFGRICAAIAAAAQIGRIGGEEFALLVEGDLPGEASTLVERLRGILSTEPLAVDRAFSIALTVSAGLAASRPGDDWSSLFGRADCALYQAKRDGRDRLAIAA